MFDSEAFLELINRELRPLNKRSYIFLYVPNHTA